MNKQQASDHWSNVLDMLNSRREALGMSIYAIQKHTGLSLSVVQNYFKGKTIPSVAAYYQILDAIDMYDQLYLKME